MASSATPTTSNTVRRAVRLDRAREQHDGDRARDEVDVEDPAPAHVVGDEAAQRRPDRGAEDDAHRVDRLARPELLGRNVSRTTCAVARIPPPNAPCTRRKTITRTERRRHPAGERGDRETDDRGEKVRFATEAQLQPRRKRDDDDVCDDVGREDPRPFVDVAPRLPLIVGSATLTIVASIDISKSAASITAQTTAKRRAPYSTTVGILGFSC